MVWKSNQNYSALISNPDTDQCWSEKNTQNWSALIRTWGVKYWIFHISHLIFHSLPLDISYIPPDFHFLPLDISYIPPNISYCASATFYSMPLDISYMPPGISYCASATFHSLPLDISYIPPDILFLASGYLILSHHKFSFLAAGYFIYPPQIFISCQAISCIPQNISYHPSAIFYSLPLAIHMSHQIFHSLPHRRLFDLSYDVYMTT